MDHLSRRCGLVSWLCFPTQHPSYCLVQFEQPAQNWLSNYLVAGGVRLPTQVKVYFDLLDLKKVIDQCWGP
jgi:hypothetical protein